MLPRAEPPARRLPYTTADMSERLAKKKAEQEAAAQAQANQALRFGVTNPPVREDKGGGGGLWPSWKELGNAAKIGLGGVAGMVNTVVATPLDIVDEAVQGLERLVGVKPTDKFDPASMGSFNLLGEAYRGVDRAANYTAGNIAATPGVGKPSSSPFMDTVRSRGWAEAFAEPVVHAVNVGSVAYPASKVAVGAKLPGTIADTYRQRLLEREIAAQNNLFPAVQRPANVIDVDALQGSRLPARVFDSPAPPATRLAEAQTQRALPPSVQRALPPATTADMAEQLARAQARQTTQFNEPLLIDKNFALSIKEGTFNPSSYRGIHPNATYSFGEINISRPGAKEDGFIRFEIHKFDNKTIDRIELDIVDSNLNYAEKRAAIKEIYDRYPKAEILWADMLEGAPEVSLAKEFEALYGRTNFDLVPDEKMRFYED